jgi:hypothetical protein
MTIFTRHGDRVPPGSPTTAMNAQDSSCSRGQPTPPGDAACYRETVRLLASLSQRHRSALEEFACSDAASRMTEEAPTALADQLGEQVVRLEDAAVEALARLARITDYEDALAAMRESGSVVWLWGAVLNRAIEATDMARVSRKR